MKRLDGHKLSILVFSFYFSWLLAFLYEGRVLYKIAERYQIEVHTIVFSIMIFHFLGLCICGFWIKTIKNAKSFLIISIIFCILGSVFFFFPPTLLWNMTAALMAFMTGGAVAAWGYFYKQFTPAGNRMSTAADVLMGSNLLMIMINIVAVNLHDYMGFALSIAMLLIALYLAVCLPTEINTELESNTEAEIKKEILVRTGHLKRPLTLLYIFIMIITINAGLMYQVIMPAFAAHRLLVSWYWAIPYITVLYLMKHFSQHKNRAYTLYIAIAMIGFCFIMFMILDRSAISFVIINTLMLGACGIYDLFWWSILGEMIELDKNPAKIMGIGLSANVLGVFAGGILGKTIVILNIQAHYISLLAFGVILITFMLLPLLHKELLEIIRNRSYLSEGERGDLAERKENEKDQKTTDKITSDIFKEFMLTDRECEIAELLLNGRTYKMIAAELFLSENTVKTHIKNIYSKLQVSNKTELIYLYQKNKTHNHP